MSRFVNRPFRFGVQVHGAADGAAWAEMSRRIEGLGYATATMPDHFTGQLAPLPALQAMADATSTLRVGALVFDNDYKHPIVLAKEMATMDVLSGGRIELGIGAGWMASDYEQAGIPFDRAGVRIDRLEEAVAVIKGAMAEGPFSFTGRHYTVSEYDGQPLPVQRPHPPLLIGGGGRRVLTIAAEQADIVGINGSLTARAIGPDALATMVRDAVAAKVDIVADAAAGRLEAIELNIRIFFVAVTEDPASVVDGVAGMFDQPPSSVRDSPFAVIGPTAQIAEDLVRLREELGFSYVVVGQDDIDSFAPVVAALSGT